MTGAGAWRTSWHRAATRMACAGMPSWWMSGSSVRGWSGWPARLPGNSQRLSELVALFMFCRLLMSWSRMPASLDPVHDRGQHRLVVRPPTAAALPTRRRYRDQRLGGLPQVIGAHVRTISSITNQTCCRRPASLQMRHALSRARSDTQVASSRGSADRWAAPGRAGTRRASRRARSGRSWCTHPGCRRDRGCRAP